MADIGSSVAYSVLVIVRAFSPPAPKGKGRGYRMCSVASRVMLAEVAEVLAYYVRVLRGPARRAGLLRRQWSGQSGLRTYS